MNAYGSLPSAHRAERVVVGVSGSPGSRTALRAALSEAVRRGAELWAVTAWVVPGGLVATRRAAPDPLMAQQCRSLAWDALVDSLDGTLGGTDPGVPLRALPVHGAPGRSLVDLADREGDLLVVGAGRSGALRRFQPGPVARYCLMHATCSVMAVPPSPLEAEWKSVRRRNALGLPLDTGRLLGTSHG
ncbi:universal stress protein [Streptomyces sp. NPDC059176]|uniref:universal stress protein n=1 Tax=unclassified Streptomyces TaxID=2593676 RepID=UPI0036BC4646